MSLTCGGCDNTWTGLSRTHCGACHITLNGIGLFDLHRSQESEHGLCLDPAAIVGRDGQPRMFLRNGIWSGPESTEEEKQRLRDLRKEESA